MPFLQDDAEIWGALVQDSTSPVACLHQDNRFVARHQCLDFGVTEVMTAHDKLLPVLRSTFHFAMRFTHVLHFPEEMKSCRHIAG